MFGLGFFKYLAGAFLLTTLVSGGIAGWKANSLKAAKAELQLCEEHTDAWRKKVIDQQNKIDGLKEAVKEQNAAIKAAAAAGELAQKLQERIDRDAAELAKATAQLASIKTEYDALVVQSAQWTECQTCRAVLVNLSGGGP